MASARTPCAGPTPSRLCVLVVDDEPAICAVGTSAVKRAGYEALSALSGEAAHELLRSYRIDVHMAVCSQVKLRELKSRPVTLPAAVLENRLDIFDE